MNDFQYFFNQKTDMTDFEDSLEQYQAGMDSDKFAGRLLPLLGLDKYKKTEIRFVKTGAFAIIFKISAEAEKNKRSAYYLKFFRNKSPVPEYTTDRMKELCMREYIVLKAAESKLAGETDINVIKAASIIPELACLITRECAGTSFDGYVRGKVKASFINPFSSWDKKLSGLYAYNKQIARLLAKIHELNLEYGFFSEKEPFYLLDFDYKKEKFLNGLSLYAPERAKEAGFLLNKLTEKSKKIFSMVQPTGLACPDTNLTNFIVNKNNVFVMDFFLSQYGPAYLSLGKFMACLELTLYPFIPEEYIKGLRKSFIDTYNQTAERYKLDRVIIDFFISWNYMTLFPRGKFSWRNPYHKQLFTRKLNIVFSDWKGQAN